MKAFFTFLMVFCVSFLMAQPILEWERTYGNSNDQQLIDGVATNNGGAVFIDNSNQLKLITLDEEGKTINENDFRYPDGLITNATAIGALPDGNILVSMKTEIEEHGASKEIGLLAVFDNQGIFIEYLKEENFIAFEEIEQIKSDISGIENRIYLRTVDKFDYRNKITRYTPETKSFSLVGSISVFYTSVEDFEANSDDRLVYYLSLIHISEPTRPY